MKAYGTITAKVIYQGKECQIGVKCWVTKGRKDEDIGAAVESHCKEYGMQLLEIVGFQVASDYAVTR